MDVDGRWAATGQKQNPLLPATMQLEGVAALVVRCGLMLGCLQLLTLLT